MLKGELTVTSLIMNGLLHNITSNSDSFPVGDIYVDSLTSCSKQCCVLKIEKSVEQRLFSATKFSLDQSIEGKLRSPIKTLDESTLHNKVRQSMKCFVY